jgi:iron uptake system component EfeO
VLAIAGAVLLTAGIAACGGTAPASVAPPPSGVVAIEATDQGGYKFTPSAVTVAAGKVTFYVRNAGTQEHEFEIFKGETVVDEVEGLVPGLAKNLTVDLASGEYTFMCKLSGHDLAGMKGTLTVN